MTLLCVEGWFNERLRWRCSDVWPVWRVVSCIYIEDLFRIYIYIYLYTDCFSGPGRVTPLYVCLSVSPDVDLYKTRMWANAQRDGRPTEYRWRPLFNAAKFGWRPLLDCRVVTLPRRETRWNLQGCPKLANRSQPLVRRSLPYCRHIWGRYCCLTNVFPIVDTCLSSEIVVRWCQYGDFFVSCISSEPRAAHFRHAF